MTKVGRLVFINLCVTLVLLASIELVTRVTSWVSGDGFVLKLHEVDPTDSKVESIYRWHPFVGFTFAPNSQIRGGHPNQDFLAQNFTDSRGLIGPDAAFAVDKVDNEIRIATVGGSTTANLNLDYSQNWPGQLVEHLRKSIPERKITVANGGTPGFHTSQSIANLALRLMPLSPDVVVIYHAYNDLKAIALDGTFSPDYAHIHRKPFGFIQRPPLWEQWLAHSMAYVRIRNRARLINELERDLTPAARLDTPPAEAVRTFERNLRSLIGIAHAGGADVVLVTFVTMFERDAPWDDGDYLRSLPARYRAELSGMLRFIPGLSIYGVMRSLAVYNDVIRRVAEDTQVAMVDLAKTLPRRKAYFVDRVHFSVTGAQAFAHAIAPTVNDVIEKRVTLTSK